MTLPNPIIDKAVAVITANVPALIAVYLYGSQATGGIHRASDVDLAILSESIIPPLSLWGLKNKLMLVTSHDVDLIALAQASTVIQAQIVGTGRCILDAQPEKRGSFEDRVYSSYALLNEERTEILKDIEMRGTVYGG